MADQQTRTPAPAVGLFVTCLVDAIRPEVGFAVLRLLEEAGCRVEVPARQTCCGQPGYNSGATDAATGLARQFVDEFEPFEHVVVPSGSCAGMIRHHYSEMLAGDPGYAQRAEAVAGRTYEIMDYLHTIRGFRPTGRTLRATATYHDSCAGLRELGIHAQPRAMLAAIDGLELRKLEGDNVCCGFGGTFCVKYPAISNAIVDEKAAAIERTEADLLLAGDLGCLMNMAGKLNRRGARTRCFHTVEVLAGMASGPAIGEAR
jgi:L-lactate dehydrogenase complex protein LldE